MDKANIYTVGGTVQAGGGIYISRQADEELLTLCQERIFAYVLTPRQMGKSSLMVRTAEKLAEEDIQCIIIDLTQLGVQVTAEQWYLGLLTIIEGTLDLDTDVVQWWQAHTHLGFTQRLTLFFQKVLLVEVSSPVVIFVDEIDTTLSLDFTDDFFAAIRYLYVARSLEQEFHRLSVVLIGVATPGDLIRDPKRTPFNIGQRVDITDFTFEEARPLADGLGLPTDEAQQVLKWVVKWTGGHPYLTQRLCSIMREQGKSSWSKVDVDRVVSSTFLGAMSEQDNNLQFVRDMLTKRAPDLEGVLTIYREIRRGKRLIPDEEQSIVKSHLKLSGVVRRENAHLCVRNLIYGKVFDDRWLKELLPVPFKRLTAQMVLLTSLVVTSLTLGIRQLGVLQPLELQAYDQLMRLRPTEAPDPRILLVAITEEDIQREKWPITDSTINRLLAKLQSYQPRVIGLDIYRLDQKNLAAGVGRADNIISICAFSSMGSEEIAPPPNFPIDNVGFSDLIPDEDHIVRRSLLFAKSAQDNKCKTSFSFASRIATKYLEKQGIKLHFIKRRDFQLGKTFFRTLTDNSGSYKHLDAKGHQILLNYHHPDHFAEQVSLTQVLTDQINPNLVKDRLVIISTTARSLNPGFYTPYGASPKQPPRMPTVFIHAQVASQLISAVLDGRPLIWYWFVWEEFLWIWGWSVVGSFLAWRIRNLRLLGLAEGSALGILYGLSFAIFTYGGWIPLIPPAIALVITSGSVVASHITLQKQERLKISKSLIDKLEITCTLRGEQMTDVIARLITKYIEQNISPTSSTDGRSKKSDN